MPYRVLADGIVVLHLLFLLYVTVGGFVAWRWPRSIVLHLFAVAWGVASVVVGFECPLTDAENWARDRAGETGLPPSGFIDHYLTGVIYPDSALGLGVARALVAACILVSWVGLWRRSRRLRSVSS
ncbi:DUF2784 domain-containing protein [Gordonia rhizosphera]|uniref:DUF2784 domain-containing protein n=1 Tax=Gordonia rhizosphera NBRC 16068 TaxID=1108045 RepID=K6WI54_9ACTN|nr:DUF2784 domain-containing protein [Gordonia rhizosphera]GAB91807.1 hypothetical protein GORHZ_150_00050 [Gordonia rhizosphera NBRC 16068]